MIGAGSGLRSSWAQLCFGALSEIGIGLEAPEEAAGVAEDVVVAAVPFASAAAVVSQLMDPLPSAGGAERFQFPLLAGADFVSAEERTPFGPVCPPLLPRMPPRPRSPRPRGAPRAVSCPPRARVAFDVVWGAPAAVAVWSFDLDLVRSLVVFVSNREKRPSQC